MQRSAALLEREEVLLPGDAAEEAHLAVRNAVKLGGSLAITWSIAIVIRLALPRFLGPDRFGALNFADAFTTACFVLLQLGIDTYVRTAVAVRPGHAREFLGGVLVLRLGLAGLVTAGMIAILRATHRPAELEQLVLALGAAQVLISLNLTLGALLQAAGKVDGLSFVTVAGKVIWGGGVALAIATGGNLLMIAAASCAAEAVKLVALWRLSSKHLRLEIAFDARATLVVLVAAFPYFLNSAAQTVYAKLDVSLLSFLVGDREVGYYGAAAALGQVAALVTPLIGWVLVPLFARAAERSREELLAALQRSLEFCFTIAVPASLTILLGADLWVGLLFGPAFAPAALSLRVLAPLFVLTYATTTMASALVADGRGWTVTGITIGGMLLIPVLNLALIPVARSWLQQEGAGGVGCAMAILVTEAMVTAAMLVVLRGKALDRRSLSSLGKMLAAGAVAVALERLLPLPPAPRLALAMSAWLLVALVSGAVRPQELAGFARAAFRREHA